MHTEESEILLFAGSELGNVDAMAGATVAPPIVRETASWLNQIEPSNGPVEVRVTARSFDEAKRCGSAMLAALQPLVTGDPSRIRTTADVRPDAPTGGTVAVKADLTAAR